MPIVFNGGGGVVGDTGVRGATGTAGLRGATGAGLTGATGSGLRGATGTTGLRGATGTGFTGATGTTGLKGATGTNKGDTGNTGLTGATGVGLAGATGVGLTGATGTTGLRGATGTLGQHGDTGTIGLRGATGTTGLRGATGVGIAGATGTSGLRGATGTTGLRGATGVGITGATGTTGLRGATGTTGLRGATGTGGIRGATGTTGLKGSTGNTGLKGSTGTIGSTGIAGTDKLSNRIFVGAAGDYATLKLAVDWFNASATEDTQIIVDAGHHNIAATVHVHSVNNKNLRIQGLGSNVTFLDAATGLATFPMFDIVTATDISSLTCDGSALGSYGTGTGENCFNFATTASLYSEITDIIINKFKIGMADTIGTDIFVFNFVVSNCGKGVSQNHATAATDTMLDLEVGNFELCTVGIDLLKASSASFIFSHLVFLHAATETAILYTGGAGNYVLDSAGGTQSIIGCSYNVVGTFISGFDFTIARDSNVELTANIGEEDGAPHAKINTLANVSTTTITTAGLYYKLAFSNGFTYASKFTLADGKMTFLSKNRRDGRIWLSGNLSEANNGRTAKVAIRRNVVVSGVSGNGTIVTVTSTGNHNLSSGTSVQMLGWTGGTGTWNGVYTITVTGLTTFTYLSSGNGVPTGGTAGEIISPMNVRCTTSGIAYPFSIVAYIEDVSLNDYYDLYATSSTNGDVITLSEINWLFDTR